MAYVIADGNKFLMKNPNSSYDVTDNISCAVIFTVANKANKTLKHISQMKKLKKYTFSIKYFTRDNDTMEIHIEEPKKIEIDEMVDKLSNVVSDIENRRNYINYQIHNVDLEIVDIEHAMEFYQLSACEGYKLYKRMHDALIRRRQYKDELFKINGLLSTTLNSNNLNSLTKSFDKLSERTYTPRVDKELFHY